MEDIPALFPLHPRDVEDTTVDAERVAMFSVPRSMWFGQTFSSIKYVCATNFCFRFLFFEGGRGGGKEKFSN